jgi:hypothetical protein
MERRELDYRKGHMCAKRADAGRPGILSKPVGVLDMVAPSGRVTVMLSVAMKMASRVLKVLEKWPVASVSITLVEFVGSEGVNYMGVTLLLVIVKLLALGMCLTGPLDQERGEVQYDAVRGLGVKLVVSPPSYWWRSRRTYGLRQDRDTQHWCG